MITFLQVFLYLFAVCAALGIIPAAVLAARAMSAAGVILALVVAAIVIFVLVTAAGELR